MPILGTNILSQKACGGYLKKYGQPTTYLMVVRPSVGKRNIAWHGHQFDRKDQISSGKGAKAVGDQCLKVNV